MIIEGNCKICGIKVNSKIISVFLLNELIICQHCYNKWYRIDTLLAEVEKSTITSLAKRGYLCSICKRMIPEGEKFAGSEQKPICKDCLIRAGKETK